MITNPKVEESLESIGMNKKEIEVYLNLVRYGTSSALEISKRTGIHRSNTYDLLNRLIGKGFIEKLILGDKAVFKALDPEKIKDYLRHREKEFEIIVPELVNFRNAEGPLEGISISEGVFSLRSSAESLLELNDTILTYGASKETVSSFGEAFLKEFHKERTKRKILMKHIYNASAVDRVRFLNKLKLTEAKYLPEKYDTNVCTTICGNTVTMFIFGKPILIITIRNKNIADAYKGYFNLLWKQSILP